MNVILIPIFAILIFIAGFSFGLIYHDAIVKHLDIRFGRDAPNKDVNQENNDS